MLVKVKWGDDPGAEAATIHEMQLIPAGYKLMQGDKVTDLQSGMHGVVQVADVVQGKSLVLYNNGAKHEVANEFLQKTSAMVDPSYPLAGEPGWSSVPNHTMDWLKSVKPDEEFGHQSDCISPKCNHDWNDEERHQLSQYGEIVCPQCGTQQTIHGQVGPYDDFQNPQDPGKGGTRSGIDRKMMGDIGEKLVERANNLPCGRITHNFQAAGAYNNPVDFTTVDQHGNQWGVEVKAIDSRATPRFKLGGAAEVGAKVKYCFDHQLRQGLVGVRLNFFTDEADLFWRPQFTDPYLGDTTMQHIGTLNFADLNPFRDPATGDHNVPQETPQDIPY